MMDSSVLPKAAMDKRIAVATRALGLSSGLALLILLCPGARPLFGAVGDEITPAPILIPLTDPTNWQLLEYRMIPPHQVRFSSEGLEIRVQASAMPLIYPLGEPVKIR